MTDRSEPRETAARIAAEIPAGVPAAEAALLARLSALGIAWTRHAHPPLHTVEESRALRGALPGAHCKNLFLRDPAGDHWLAVCREDRRIRIGDLARAVGARRFSFGGPEAMAALLGVAPGAVTPLGLVHDTGRAVRLILDRQMMQADIINCHPLHNEATLAISTRDLMRVFDATGHAPQPVDFDALEGLAAG